MKEGGGGDVTESLLEMLEPSPEKGSRSRHGKESRRRRGHTTRRGIAGGGPPSENGDALGRGTTRGGRGAIGRRDWWRGRRSWLGTHRTCLAKYGAYDNSPVAANWR
jgi:hypothetical protein